MCVCRWDGSGAWQFDVLEPPVHDNYLVYGPALGRWGELSTYVNVAPGDGQALLSVQTTDLGGGVYHYEYALLNLNSDRCASSNNLRRSLSFASWLLRGSLCFATPVLPSRRRHALPTGL
jgi:hypothetical protein